MDWRRGLFRLWVMASVIWVVAVIALFLPAALGEDLHGWFGLAAFVVLPPVLLLMLGRTLGWVLSGFRQA
jgi:hypothetical protein